MRGNRSTANCGRGTRCNGHWGQSGAAAGGAGSQGAGWKEEALCVSHSLVDNGTELSALHRCCAIPGAQWGARRCPSWSSWNVESTKKCRC